METMTKGRVYVEIVKGNLKSITYFDNKNKRNKLIEFKYHKGKNPHVHQGYFHNEYSINNDAARLNTKEKKMVENVKKIWYDFKKRNS